MVTAMNSQPITYKTVVVILSFFDGMNQGNRTAFLLALFELLLKHIRKFTFTFPKFETVFILIPFLLFPCILQMGTRKTRKRVGAEHQKSEAFGQFFNSQIARMFGDIFTGVLGLGAAMWTKKVGN